MGYRPASDPPVVDHARQISGTEPVVDIDDADSACAGIQHGQKGGKPSEGSAVPHAGRDGDHRTVRKAAYDGGEGAFHPGDRDDDFRTHDFFPAGEQTVNACNTDIIKAGHFISEDFSGQRGFLRDGNIAGASGRDDDRSYAVRFRERAEKSQFWKRGRGDLDGQPSLRQGG